ncbi:MAG: sulfatase-like hydrolase/transferase [Clostridiaceae bacterium]|nr:sulfatase-like hydrolase/transferase [Clostridiaceae bacterium]
MVEKPNILFILTDDQGAWAMRCAGNADVITPNLDRLAADGTRFDHFFCASPVCSPARASILTGTIPSAHGVQDWLRGGNVDPHTPGAERHPELAHDHAAIRYLDNLTCYTDLLAESGYTCALSGKWHLGASLEPQHGFSHWFTIARGGCNYDKPDLVRDGKLSFETRYVTDLITEDALSTLDTLSQAAAPFYLSVHYTAPHSPWDREEHPADVWDLYEGCEYKATPELPYHPWQVETAPHGTGERRRELLRGYYTAITAMDRGVGRLLDRLDALGLVDNTLVIFTGDNGMNLGQHGVWGKGNGTFPMNMYDTSVMVPCIIRGPKVARAAVCDVMLSHLDILPTLREYLSLAGEVRQPLPGRSFAPILSGGTLPDTPVVVFDEYGPVRMLRTRTHKLVVRYPYGPDELYDLICDPDETQNRIEDPAYAALRVTMRAELESWFVRYADPPIDGARSGVTGSGQLCRPGIYAKGKPVFAPIPPRIAN